MSKLVPMPSPRGTNREGLYLRSSGSGAAYDAGVPWTKERQADAQARPGAVDLDEKIEHTRKALDRTSAEFRD